MQNMNNYIVIGFVVLYYTVTLFLVRRVRFTTHNICLCSIVVSMTLVLESIQIPLPTGATIALCSPVPLMVLAIVTDYRLAIIAGWLCGLLAMLMAPGWQLVHWGQFLWSIWFASRAWATRLSLERIPAVKFYSGWY